MSKVDELKEHFIELVDKGCTRFGWTVGPKWHSLSLEEKAEAILGFWTAPKGPLVFNDSYNRPPKSLQPPIALRELVKNLEAGPSEGIEPLKLEN